MTHDIIQTSSYYAVKTLLDNHIDAFPVTDEKIIRMLDAEGYTVIAYGFPLSQTDSEDFEELKLLDTAKSYTAFTYCDENVKYVFYRTTLSVTERTLALAHELGHIRLRHIAPNKVLCSSSFRSRHPQELEADEFALELLAPKCLLKRIRPLTPEKISHLTLLEHSASENIFFRLRRFHFLTKDERALKKQFSKKENVFLLFVNKTHRKENFHADIQNQ